METAAITAWLASEQPFVAGVALYAALGTNATYKMLFGLGETAYSRQVLVRELGLISLPVFTVTTIEDALKSRPYVNDSQEAASYLYGPRLVPAPAPGPESPLLLALRQQRRECYDARSLSHAQLTARNLGKLARFELAFRVLALTDHITELQVQEAHVLEHGRLPGPVPTADVTDAGILRQRLANLRSRRSKLRARHSPAVDLDAINDEIALIQLKLQS